MVLVPFLMFNHHISMQNSPTKTHFPRPNLRASSPSSTLVHTWTGRYRDGGRTSLYNVTTPHSDDLFPFLSSLCLLFWSFIFPRVLFFIVYSLQHLFSHLPLNRPTPAEGVVMHAVAQRTVGDLVILAYSMKDPQFYFLA